MAKSHEIGTDGGKIKRLHSLKPHHYQAIDLMLQGWNDTQISSKLGMARETVSRWKKQNTLFIEEFEKQRSELNETIRERQLVIALKALDKIEEQVECDVKTALSFIKHFGIKPNNAQLDKIVDKASKIEEG